MDLYCLLLRWEMALGLCLLVELLLPLLHPQLVITQWQISLLALRWEDLHQCHLHKAFPDNKCRVRVFVHPHHLLTWAKGIWSLQHLSKHSINVKNDVS
ncbi:hypothetical protein Pyn_34142 [Prunus yedoensis var. nudiflora]|uniref:Uncharacterized protein n=1 Tax=Prunus yedoensis var. nudiflora TaxID=2094558 RepID=A0A314XPP8_PRUYE|nr:hypothetical protein Pyn_34142 [Prunus yedoensis var. nudiflora]